MSRHQIALTLFVAIPLVTLLAWNVGVLPGTKSGRERSKWGQRLAIALSSEAQEKVAVDKLLSHRGSVRHRYLTRLQSHGYAMSATLIRTMGKPQEARHQFLFKVRRRGAIYREWYLVADDLVQDFSYSRIEE